MKNQKGMQNRLIITFGYILGFILGMQSKNWWALPSSIIVTLIVSFLIFFFKKLFEIWGIGSKHAENMTRQQRRNLKRLSNQND